MSTKSGLKAGSCWRILAFSLVFLVSEASYKALYKTSFASVLYDFALRERGESNKINADKVSYEASYEAPLTRKTSFILSIVFSQIFVEKNARICWICYKRTSFWNGDNFFEVTLDMTHMHLCSCKTFAKIVSIQKPYIWNLNSNEWQNYFRPVFLNFLE